MVAHEGDSPRFVGTDLIEPVQTAFALMSVCARAQPPLAQYAVCWCAHSEREQREASSGRWVGYEEIRPQAKN